MVNTIAQSSLNSRSEALGKLLSEIEALDRAHAATRKSRKFAHRLQTFIAFIERYSPAVDVGIQGTLSAATVIWGCLRMILIVCPLVLYQAW